MAASFVNTLVCVYIHLYYIIMHTAQSFSKIHMTSKLCSSKLIAYTLKCKIQKVVHILKFYLRTGGVENLHLNKLMGIFCFL